MEVQVTFKGKDVNELRMQASAFFKSSATPVTGSGSNVAPTITKKKAAPVVEDDEELDLLADDSSEDVELDEETFDEEIEEEPAPKKTTKAKEITEKQVQDAAKLHAAKNGEGRKKTLAILQKKFKVQSVGELDKKQYAAVIAALKV